MIVIACSVFFPSLVEFPFPNLVGWVHRWIGRTILKWAISVLNSLIVGETGMTSQCQVNGKLGQQLVSFSIWLSNKYHVNILLIYRPLCRNSFGLRFKNELLSPLYSIFSLKKKLLAVMLLPTAWWCLQPLNQSLHRFATGKTKRDFLFGVGLVLLDLRIIFCYFIGTNGRQALWIIGL